MFYRIYTEDVNRPKIEKIIGRFFEGFTLITGRGFWKGKAEDSLIIEIFATSNDCPNVRERIDVICEEINTSNKQECCMVVTSNVDVRYI